MSEVDTERTQQHRHLAIDTPLGTDKVLLLSMYGNDSIGRLFQYEIDIVSVSNPIEPRDILGKNVSIRLELLAENHTRYFNGYISRISLIAVDETAQSKRLFTYRATMVPWVWFLTRKADCRIFQEMTVPDILKKILTDGEVRFDLRRTYRKWEYCVQYRETDFNFISRLMENEGIYYYFEHANGKHTMVVVDSSACHKPAELYSKLIFDEPDPESGHDAFIWDWTIKQEITPTLHSLTDFDPLQPKNNLFKKNNVEHTHDPVPYEIFDYPGGYVSADEGKEYAQARMEESESQYIVGHGSSAARGLYAGAIFALQNHPVCPEEDYLITSINYQLQNDDLGIGHKSIGELFHCEVTTIPNKNEFRTPRTTPKPFVQGPQTAFIVGKAGEEVWTDKYGRVKVQFHWDRDSKADENSSCWVRVSQNWAGKRWGAIFIPRIGQEVIVDFLEGDPDRPIITGRVYNGDNLPPYDLPTYGTVSTIKTNSSKGGGGFNEIRFEDKKGSEQVFHFAQKDYHLRIKNNRLEYVGNEQHLTVEHKAYAHYKKPVHLTYDEEIHEKITKDVHLNLEMNLMAKIGGNLSLSVGGNLVESVGGNHVEDVKGNYYLKAASGLCIECPAGISIMCGGSSVVLDSSGVSITGTSVTIMGSVVKINSGPGSPPTPGSPAQPESPVDPDPAQLPTTGDPGQLSEVPPGGRTPPSGKLPSTPVGPYVPPTPHNDNPPTKPKHVEFKLVDPDDKPVANEKALLHYPDGSTKNASTDGSGLVKVDGDDADKVQISFPDRVDAAWDHEKTVDA
jgi:type VI secretion system secreted protein VgrG